MSGGGGGGRGGMMCDRENICLLNHHLYRASGVKKSQIEQSLNPTHEGMVKVTSVLDFF